MDYRFLVIDNRHSALEYFFHYNHGLNSNKWAYFKSESSNSLKVYIFGMCKLRGIIWYIIHGNRMLLKIWPHLTFGWPFVNIALTMHPTHSKLYIVVILITSRVIWYTWKVIWSILKIWPLHDPYWEGAKSSKILSKYFLTYNDFKTINNSFSSKWHLSTSSTTVFISDLSIKEITLDLNGKRFFLLFGIFGCFVFQISWDEYLCEVFVRYMIYLYMH